VVVDGSPVVTVGPGATSALVRLSIGRHTWRVVATDVVGNESSAAARALVVRRAAARPRLRIARPSAVKSGARPRLRVRATRAARVSFTVRKAGGKRTLARQARGVRAGSSTVVLSRKVARRLAKPGVYVVTARAAGMRASVRLAVRSRR
jgi:hypothetical protein